MLTRLFVLGCAVLISACGNTAPRTSLGPDCRYESPQGCTSEMSEACLNAGCDVSACSCTNAGVRDTCRCEEPESKTAASEQCDFVDDNGACLANRAAACGECPTEQCACTEAGSRNTCTCQNVESCPFIDKSGDCLTDRAAACGTCPSEQCTCTEAASRNTCECMGSSPCPFVDAATKACVKDRVTACGSCPSERCVCTEATTRSTCSCKAP